VTRAPILIVGLLALAACSNVGLHHPAIGDHWHTAYGIYVCDHFVTPIQNVNDIDGIHTHGDGLVHVHPFSSKTTGANADLGAFAKATGMTLTDTNIADGEFGSVTAGDACNGKPMHLEVAVWDSAAATTPTIHTKGLASVAFDHDLSVMTIAAVPDGVQPPKPPWVGILDEIRDVVTPTTAPPTDETIQGDTPCPGPGTSPHIVRFAKAPPMCIDTAKSYIATVTTTEGAFTVALDAKAAPKAVNVVVTLARYHFYDGSPLFQINTGAVFIGGDPVGHPAGTAGPGFSFSGERPSSSAAYVAGAFGLIGDDKGDNGGQFFVVTAAHLPNQQPTLPVIGRVTDPDGTLAKIDKHGTTSGNVFDPVTVKTITIEER
jgi:cyclophilin family peptidyl-prolyl cis-trans isomerase